MFNDPFASGVPGQPAPSQDLSFDYEMPDEVLIPEGQYVAKVSNLEEGETKAGDPKLVWDFMILAPDSAVGQVLSVHAGLTQKQMWKLQQILVGIGCIPAGSKSLRFTRSDAINRMCFITIKHREFQGRQTMDVDQVLPYSELGKKHIGGMGGMQPPAPAQPAAPRPTTPTQPATSQSAEATTPAPVSGKTPRRPRTSAPTPVDTTPVVPDSDDGEVES